MSKTLEELDALLSGPAQDEGRLIIEGDLPEFTTTNYFDENERSYRENPELADFSLDLSYVTAGVSAKWLAMVFHMALTTVQMRLAECPVWKQSRKMNLYRMIDAVPFLVKPKIDITSYLKNLTKSQIPEGMRVEIWDARLKEQQFFARGGDLWMTADVIEVFSEAMQEIKSAMTLLPETVEAVLPEAAEKRKELREIADGVLREVRRRLLKQMQKGSTPNSAERMIEAADGDS